MRGFMLDDKGDVAITDGLISMTSGTDFLCQTIRQLLRTNLGEWWLNEDEGIDFSCILTKNPNYEQIEDNIKSGLRQVDEELDLVNIDYKLNERKLEVDCIIQKGSTKIKIEI